MGNYLSNNIGLRVRISSVVGEPINRPLKMNYVRKRRVAIMLIAISLFIRSPLIRPSLVLNPSVLAIFRELFGRRLFVNLRGL